MTIINLGQNMTARIEYQIEIWICSNLKVLNEIIESKYFKLKHWKIENWS